MADLTDTHPLQDLMWLTIEALRRLGGTASTDEISKAVIAAAGLADDRPTGEGRDRRVTVDYQLGWARTHLYNIGAIDNSARGVWSLAALGRNLTRDEIPGRVKEHQHRCSI